MFGVDPYVYRMTVITKWIVKVYKPLKRKVSKII